REDRDMAKGRGGRPPSRLDKRREAEAAEARERDEDQEEEEAEEEDESGDEDEEGKAKKAKKPAKKPAAPRAKKTTTKRRAAKEVRRRAVWVVFDNAQKEVEEFPYNQKAEAEALLARKLQEKEGKATFYLNLVKREIKE